MSHQIYTLWAAVPEEDPGPWMIAAEDEFSWEGDPDRCETEFKQAREKAEEAGWRVVEVTLRVDYGRVAEAFRATEVAAEVSE